MTKRFTVYWREDGYWVVRDNELNKRFVSKSKILGRALQAAQEANLNNKVLQFERKVRIVGNGTGEDRS